MARPYGIEARNAVEASAWLSLQGADIHGNRRDIPQASERKKFDSNSTYETILTRSNFRSDEGGKQCKKQL